MTEIDGSHYCAGGHYNGGRCSLYDCDCAGSCKRRLRKWPTPAEFREEYGEGPEGRAVWHYDGKRGGWQVTAYESFRGFVKDVKLEKGGMAEFFKPCHVACTPWGKPFGGKAPA